MKKPKFILATGTIMFLGIFLLTSLTKEPTKRLVLIDAGHGGKDPGFVLNNISEREIVRNLATEIALLNNSTEIEVKLLTEEDEFLTISQRVERVNEMAPSLIISLHANYNEDSLKNGAEAYVTREYEPNYSESLNMANKILTRLTMFSDRGVQESGFPILAKSSCPAVVLEVGFMSNKSDREVLLNKEKREVIAYRIIEAIQEL